jgi:4-hydroxybenzoate polyprenyltransferase
VLGWIIVCMVSARSAAMAFNRLVDSEIDAVNPRTAARALPAGHVSRGFVVTFTLVSSAVFLFGAAMLNRLTLELAPLALAIVFAYSYMKRVTRWSHLVLGLSLGIAPAAAWIAVRGSFSPRAALLTAIVLLWAGGFDVLYACQDFEHDRRVGLHSVPQAFGLRGAFWVARAMHAGMAVLLFVMLHAFGLGIVALLGVVLCVALLTYEHAIVSPGDLRRLNAAFFTLNGVISVILFIFIAADVLHRR